MYTRLNKELNDFLNSFEISSHACDVFEEVILNKLASIETKPEKCQFGKVNENRMYFNIKGISESDADKFLKFLKETNGDISATKFYLSKPNLADPDELYDSHVFYVNADTIYNKIFPQFKYNIVLINENPTERFQQYKDLSEDDPDVQMFKLHILLDDILKQTADLESHCVDAYSRGELHIIFKLLDERLRLYKEHVGHGCGSFANDVRERIGMFDETCEENSFLKTDPETAKLRENLNKLQKSIPVPLSTSGFSMFSPSCAVSNQNQIDEKDVLDHVDERVNCCKIL